MKCPKCKTNSTAIIEVRNTNGNSIRRRWACSSCNHRWTTYEIILTPLDFKQIIKGRFNDK